MEYCRRGTGWHALYCYTHKQASHERYGGFQMAFYSAMAILFRIYYFKNKISKYIKHPYNEIISIRVMCCCCYSLCLLLLIKWNEYVCYTVHIKCRGIWKESLSIKIIHYIDYMQNMGKCTCVPGQHFLILIFLYEALLKHNIHSNAYFVINRIIMNLIKIAAFKLAVYGIHIPNVVCGSLGMLVNVAQLCSTKQYVKPFQRSKNILLNNHCASSRI